MTIEHREFADLPIDEPVYIGHVLGAFCDSADFDDPIVLLGLGSEVLRKRCSDTRLFKDLLRAVMLAADYWARGNETLPYSITRRADGTFQLQVTETGSGSRKVRSEAKQD